jgi:hypothetical protein
MRVLVCNCGSSSLKFCLCEVAARTSAGDYEAVRVLFNGQASPYGVIMPEMADETRPTEGEPMTQQTQPSAEFPHVPAAPGDRLVGLLATRRDKEAIEMDDLEEAIDRMVAGLEKKNRLLSPQEQKIVAYHEAGHALVAASVQHADPVHRISIIPRGIAALGSTLQLPTEDR